VQVDLSTFSATDGWGNSDTLADVEEVIGSARNDVLTGSGDDSLLLGGAGDDTISGGEGDDTLIGGAGSDIIDGGADSDTVSYAPDTGGVNIVLGGPAIDGYGNSDTLTGIENLIGSAYADVLTGDSLNNSLIGGAGTMIGSFLGVLFIGLISNGMTLMGFHPYWQEVVRGIITLVAVLTSVIG